MSSRPLIVLVHGLFMGRHAMLLLARRLKQDGFEVHCFAYNTVTGSLQTAVDKLAERLAQDPRPVSLVGHSLGGLVALQTAQNLPVGRLDAVVLLGSPYQGAQAAQVLQRLGGRIGAGVGRALSDWAKLESKPTVTAPVFTLSGTLSAGLGRLLCGFIEPNDGTVTVRETHYPGAISLTLPVSHTGMLFSPRVSEQVSTWLGSASAGRTLSRVR